MAVRHSEYTKTHESIHFKMVNFMSFSSMIRRWFSSLLYFGLQLRSNLTDQ